MDLDEMALTSTHLWDCRVAEVARRTLYRRQLARVCGCSRCGDTERGKELEAFIARTTELIESYETRLLDLVVG